MIDIDVNKTRHMSNNLDTYDIFRGIQGGRNVKDITFRNKNLNLLSLQYMYVIFHISTGRFFPLHKRNMRK